MRKKSHMLLVPVAVLIALAVVPALAQATTAQAPAGTKLAVGAAVTGQSTNLTFQTGAGQIQCKENILKGKITANGGANVTVSVESGTFTAAGGGACATDNMLSAVADITISGTPWTYTIQQPEASGAITGHLTGDIKFKAQLQAFGGSVGTCEYQATNIQTNGTELSDAVTITGSNQFTRIAGTSPCEAAGTISGTVQFESGVNGITIDMT